MMLHLGYSSAYAGSRQHIIWMPYLIYLTLYTIIYCIIYLYSVFLTWSTKGDILLNVQAAYFYTMKVE